MTTNESGRKNPRKKSSKPETPRALPPQARDTPAARAAHKRALKQIVLRRRAEQPLRSARPALTGAVLGDMREPAPYETVQRFARALAANLQKMYLHRGPAPDMQDAYLALLAKLLEVKLGLHDAASVDAAVHALADVSHGSTCLAERLLHDYQLTRSYGGPGMGKTKSIAAILGNTPPGLDLPPTSS